MPTFGAVPKDNVHLVMHKNNSDNYREGELEKWAMIEEVE